MRTTRLTLAWGVPLLYFLIASSFYLRTYDSAQIKITLWQMGGTYLIALWYFKLFDEGLSRLKCILPLVLPLALPLVLFLGSGILSFLHAPYPKPSLDDLIRRILYIHMALLVLTEWNTSRHFSLLFRWLLAAGYCSTVYGLLQFIDTRIFSSGPTEAGIDPFIWHGAFGSNVFSTFGNPNFFGNFLVVLVPIVLALILQRNPKRLFHLVGFIPAVVAVSIALIRWIHPPMYPSWLCGGIILAAACCSIWLFSSLGLLYFLATLCLLATDSKGALVGYTGGVTIFLLLTIRFFSHTTIGRLRRIMVTVMVFLLIMGAGGIYYLTRQRFNSVRFRAFTWLSTWEMILTHPVWGTGIGSFKVIYPAFRRPQIFHIEGKHNTETDHAENEYLEVWFDEGVLGLGIFLWVIITFSLAAYRGLARFAQGPQSRARPPTKGGTHGLDPRAFYALGFLSAMWAMLFHNCTDVSLRFVSSGIFLWLLIGLLGALVIHDPLEDNLMSTDSAPTPTAGRSSPIEQAPLWRWTLLQGPLSDLLRVLGSVPTVVFLYFMIVSFYEIQGPYPPSFGESLLWGISWVTLLGICGLAAYAWFRYLWSTNRWIPLLGACGILWPLMTFWGYFRADAYHNRAIFYSKQAKWEEALASYAQVLQLNPAYIMAYYFLGNVYNDRWVTGDGERAIAKYQELWRMAPNYVQSRYQAGLVYLRLGQEQQQLQTARQGKDPTAAQRAEALALDYWHKALKAFQHYHAIDPVFSPNYTRMAWIYIQLKDLTKAEALYREDLDATECRNPKHDILKEGWATTHRHENPETYVNLGDVQYYRGHLREAEESFRRALTLQPDYPNALRNLAVLLTQTQRSSEGQHVWERLRQRVPETPPFEQAVMRPTAS